MSYKSFLRKLKWFDGDSLWVINALLRLGKEKVILIEVVAQLLLKFPAFRMSYF